MMHKKSNKKEGSGLYIAICCCILLVALIGYANNISGGDEYDEEILTHDVNENMIVYDNAETEEDVSYDTISNERLITDEIVAENERVMTEVTDTSPVTKSEVIKDEAGYYPPVPGSVLCEFSADKPIYHNSTDDWRTHNGLDFEAAIGDSVSAFADGVVEKLYMGNLGYSIRIDHGDGLLSVYSNLDEKPVVALGDSVKKGDVIGHIGNSAVGDLCDAPHLHFEIISSGKYENPIEYLE